MIIVMKIEKNKEKHQKSKNRNFLMWKEHLQKNVANVLTDES